MVHDPRARFDDTCYGIAMNSGLTRNNIVILLSAPRSGTTQLAGMLRSYAKLNFLGETFHGGKHCISSWSHFHADAKPVITRAACAILGRPPLNSSEAFRAIKRDPVKALRIIAESDSSPATTFAFKVFPGHISLSEFGKILKAVRCDVIVVSRSPVDTYISRLKADKLGIWKKIDTTEIKPNIYEEKFREYHEDISNYFRAYYDVARRSANNVVTLSYDQIYKSGNPPDQVVDMMLRDLGLDVGDCATEQVLQPQDRTPNRANKVSNWDEFVEGIELMGASHMLDRIEFRNPISSGDYRKFLIAKAIRQAVRRITRRNSISA